MGTLSPSPEKCFRRPRSFLGCRRRSAGLVGAVLVLHAPSRECMVRSGLRRRASGSRISSCVSSSAGIGEAGSHADITGFAVNVGALSEFPAHGAPPEPERLAANCSATNGAVRTRSPPPSKPSLSLFPGRDFQTGRFGRDSRRRRQDSAESTTEFRICPEPDSNRHGLLGPRDFKSLASTDFATRARGSEVSAAGILLKVGRIESRRRDSYSWR